MSPHTIHLPTSPLFPAGPSKGGKLVPILLLCSNRDLWTLASELSRIRPTLPSSRKSGMSQNSSLLILMQELAEGRQKLERAAIVMDGREEIDAYNAEDGN